MPNKFYIITMKLQRIVGFSISVLQVIQLHIVMTKTETLWNVSCPFNCWCDVSLSPYRKPNMKTVNCTHKNLKMVPDIPENTQVLILKGNNLASISSLPGMRILRELDLSQNKLMLKRHGFTYLRYIVWLNLTRNSIRIINNDIFSGLRYLEILDLSHNAITIITLHAFDSLNNLNKIFLSHNFLRNIHHEWFSNLMYLKELYLDYNNLTVILNKDIGLLKYLDTLSIAGNAINRFDRRTFKGMSRLSTLDMSYNRFIRVPSATLQAFTSLTRLSLNGNPIKRLRKNDFYECQITELYISEMPVLRIIENRTFNRINRLSVLKISHNPKLFYIDPHAFCKLSHLRRLYLNDNQLIGISQEIVRLVPALRELHLYHNPLSCNCNIHWVKQLLVMAVRYNIPNIIKFPQADKITCYNPLNSTTVFLKDIPIMNLSLVCSPTSIPLFADNIQLEIGDDLLLECYSLGLPVPRISWILPHGKVVNKSTDRVNISGASLLNLHDVREDDAGTYACKVANDFGYDISSTLIRVHTSKIHIVPLGISKTFIRLTWNGSGRTVMSSRYYILCTDTSTNNIIRHVRLHQGIKRFTMTKLTPDTTYKCCIGYEHNERVNTLSCRNITTLHENYDGGGITRISKTNVIVGLVSTILTLIFLVIAVMFLRQKHRKGYRESEVRCDTTVHIPLTNMTLPPPTPLCTSTTSLLSGVQV